MGDLVKELGRGTTTILQKEVQLARAEIVQSIAQAQRATLWLVLALVPAFMALILVPLGLVYGLDAWMPRWVAALLVAGAMLGLAAVLALVGIKKMRDIEPKPERAIEQAKEEKEWLTTRLRSSMRSARSGATSTR